LEKSYGRAELALCNPEYTSNCSVVTYEKMYRNETQLFTNISFVFLVPLDNNITVVSISNNYNLQKITCLI
jgi:hypothetical protein